MKKLLKIMLLVSVLVFSAGCTKIVKVPVYIEANCPKIAVLKPVDRIDLIVGNNGTIHEPYTTNIIKGAKMLRKSESYYIEQLNKYNKKFTSK